MLKRIIIAIFAIIVSACADNGGGEVVVYGFNNGKELSIVNSPYMPKARIIVGNFSASEILTGQNIVIFDERELDYKFLENAMWVKEPMLMVRDRFVQLIDDQFNSAIKNPTQEYNVTAHIYDFYLVKGDDGSESARISMAVKVLSGDKVIMSENYNKVVPVDSKDLATTIEKIDGATAEIVVDFIGAFVGRAS